MRYLVLIQKSTNQPPQRHRWLPRHHWLRYPVMAGRIRQKHWRANFLWQYATLLVEIDWRLHSFLLGTNKPEIMALLEKQTWTRANTWYLWVACFQWHTKHIPHTQEDHFILIYEERQTSPHIFDRSNTTWEFMILSKHSNLQLLSLAEVQRKSSWWTTFVIRIYIYILCMYVYNMSSLSTWRWKKNLLSFPNWFVEKVSVSEWEKYISTLP